MGLGQDVDANDGLRPDEKRLLELYNQLPNEEEQQNMLRIVSLRLKELDELYAKYMGGGLRAIRSNYLVRLRSTTHFET